MNIKYLNEIWKDIKGYEGFYQISNFGQVKSLERYVYGRFQMTKILKIRINHSGYYNIALSKNSKKKYFLIHRLVAETFIPNPNNYQQVNHKDENKGNNCVDNLEWCDCKYNNNYGTRTKRIGNKLKNRTDQSKIILQFDLNNNFIKEWPSRKEIERSLGFSRQNVSSCCKGRIQTCCGFKWKYKSD